MGSDPVDRELLNQNGYGRSPPPRGAGQGAKSGRGERSQQSPTNDFLTPSVRKPFGGALCDGPCWSRAFNVETGATRGRVPPSNIEGADRTRATRLPSLLFLFPRQTPRRSSQGVRKHLSEPAPISLLSADVRLFPPLSWGRLLRLRRPLLSRSFSTSWSSPLLFSLFQLFVSRAKGDAEGDDKLGHAGRVSRRGHGDSPLHLVQVPRGHKGGS